VQFTIMQFNTEETLSKVRWYHNPVHPKGLHRVYNAQLISTVIFTLYCWKVTVEKNKLVIFILIWNCSEKSILESMLCIWIIQMEFNCPLTLWKERIAHSPLDSWKEAIKDVGERTHYIPLSIFKLPYSWTKA